jgi:hypothetical protein
LNLVTNLHNQILIFLVGIATIFDRSGSATIEEEVNAGEYSEGDFASRGKSAGRFALIFTIWSYSCKEPKSFATEIQAH